MKVIKLESEIIKDLDRLAYSHFLYHSISSDFIPAFEKYVKDTCYTKNGHNRYRKGFIQTLHNIFLHFKESYSNKFIVFGYWYNDEFYTTYKNRHELTLKYKLKTTDFLHDLKLSQKQWNGLDRGFYYADNLKPFFIS